MAPRRSDTEEAKAIHRNHRKRVKEKFRETGLNGMHDHNILEMLLFYSIPREDTNVTAHLLLDRFGSFSSVFEATVDELTGVDGIGLESATLIRFIGDIVRYYDIAKSKETSPKCITDSETAVKVLKPYFKAINYEKFIVLYLDGKGGLISRAEFTQMSGSSVQTDFGEILKRAILLRAEGIIVAHNHPNGFAVPSYEDIKLTRELSEQCKAVNVKFCNHVIFSGNDYCLLSRSKGVPSDVCIFI